MKNFRMFVFSIIFLAFGSMASATGPVTLSLMGNNPEAIAKNIAELIALKRFEEVNRFIDMLVKVKPMTNDGSRVLEIVYSKMAENIYDMNQLDHWAKATDHHAAYTSRGLRKIEEAWNARGIYFSNSVTADKHNRMMDHVAGAKADFLKAHKLCPKDPNAAAGMIIAALLGNWDRSEMEKWFETATEIDPSAYEAYLNKLTYLQPWWHGTQEEFFRFAGWCYDNSPIGSRVYTIGIEMVFFLSSRVSNLPAFYSSPKISSLAQAVFSRWEKDFSYSVALRNCQGQFEAGLGHYEKAVAYYTKALEIDPNRLSALRARADILFEKIDDRDGAKRDYEKILSLEPRNSWALYRLGGIAQYFDRDMKSAEEFYNKAIAIDATNLYYFWNRGNVRRALQKYGDAIEDYNNAIRLNPKHADSYAKRASARLSINDSRGALADLDIAIALDPTDADFLLQRGLLNYNAGRFEKAREDLTEARYRNPSMAKNVDALLASMNVETQAPIPQQTSPTAAKQSVNASPSIVRKAPAQKKTNGNITALLSQGRKAFFSGDDDGATKAYQQVLSQDADNLAALQGLVNIAYRNHQNLPEAEALFQRMATIEPQNINHKMNLGVVCFDQKKYTDAIERFNGIIESNSRFGPAYFYRAECYRLLNKNSLSKADYLKAKSLGGMSPEQIDKGLAKLSQ